MKVEKSEVKSLIVASSTGSIATSKLFEIFGASLETGVTTKLFQAHCLDQKMWRTKGQFTGKLNESAAGYKAVRDWSQQVILRTVKNEAGVTLWDWFFAHCAETEGVGRYPTIAEQGVMVREHIGECNSDTARNCWYAATAYNNLSNFIATKKKELKEQEKAEMEENVVEYLPDPEDENGGEENGVEENGVEENGVEENGIEENGIEKFSTLDDLKVVIFQAVKNGDKLRKPELLEILAFANELLESM